MLRAATDVNPNLIVVSVDGIGAYNHILRASMFIRLRNMPKAREFLSFVHFYVQLSEYSWYNDSGRQWTVCQAEGRGRRARGPNDASSVLHWHQGAWNHCARFLKMCICSACQIVAQTASQVRHTFIQIRKKNSSKNTFIQKHLTKTISSKTEDNFIHDTFIPKRFHPMTLSSQTTFIPNPKH